MTEGNTEAKEGNAAGYGVDAVEEVRVATRLAKDPRVGRAWRAVMTTYLRCQQMIDSFISSEFPRRLN